MEAEGRERSSVDATKTFNRIVHNDPIGKVRADKLTQRHLEAWRERLESGEMSGRKRGRPAQATGNRNLTALKERLNRAVGRRELPHEGAFEGTTTKTTSPDSGTRQ